MIGKVFWPGAVAALAGPSGDGTPGPGELDEGELEEYLPDLVRKQFLRRERVSSIAGQTQYAFIHVLVRDVAYGQIPRAARADKHVRAAGWVESLGRPADHAEMLAHHYLSALELSRAADQDTAALVPRARGALHAAGDRAIALNALPAAAGYYRATLALWPQDAQAQRAGVLRLLGTVLLESGELEQAGVVLAEGAEVAAAAGLSAVRARIRVLLAEIRSDIGEALAECQAAIAVLDSVGDLDGLAEAWLLTGRLRFFLRANCVPTRRLLGAPWPTPSDAATTARRCRPAAGWWRPSCSSPSRPMWR